MTNVEFLVNELRKANETIDRRNKEIDSLNKEIARLKAVMGKLFNAAMCSEREMAELWQRTIENM